MKLTTKDRVIFNSLYPKENNIISQTLIRDIDNKVRLTQDEFKKIDFKIEGGKATWNDKSKDKDVEFTELELNLLKSQVDKLDKEKKITQAMLDVCLNIRGENNGSNS